MNARRDVQSFAFAAAWSARSTGIGVTAVPFRPRHVAGAQDAGYGAGRALCRGGSSQLSKPASLGGWASAGSAGVRAAPGERDQNAPWRLEVRDERGDVRAVMRQRRAGGGAPTTAAPTPGDRSGATRCPDIAERQPVVGWRGQARYDGDRPVGRVPHMGAYTASNARGGDRWASPAPLVARQASRAWGRGRRRVLTTSTE